MTFELLLTQATGTAARGSPNDTIAYAEAQMIRIISRVSDFQVFNPVRTLLFSEDDSVQCNKYFQFASLVLNGSKRISLDQYRDFQ